MVRGGLILRTRPRKNISRKTDVNEEELFSPFTTASPFDANYNLDCSERSHISHSFKSTFVRLIRVLVEIL
jgi:hypothetical protein